MNFYHEEDHQPLATMSEAVDEWRYAVGQDRTDQQWILSDYDSWERNPFYQGPDQPHPEADEYEDYVTEATEYDPAAEADQEYYAAHHAETSDDGSDDIPF